MGGGASPFDYVDQVTITATNTAMTTINPSSISSTGINTVTLGNTITGTSSGSGVNLVSFSGSCITSITLSFRTGPNVKSNPNAQQYAIQDINSDESVGGAFPVNYKDFFAVQLGNSLKIQWQTAAEINNEGYAIQKSSDAKSFENIGFVYGQNGQSNYIFVDDSPKSGHNYYRLEQKDFDGTKTLSKIISVLFLPDGEIKVFPNPAQAGENLTITGLANNGNYEVYSLNGQKVFKSNKSNISLQSGNYLIKVFHPYGFESKKLIVR